jgi:hypothetical protein
MKNEPRQADQRTKGDQDQQPNAHLPVFCKGHTHRSEQRVRRLCSHCLDRAEAYEEGEEHEGHGAGTTAAAAA